MMPIHTSRNGQCGAGELFRNFSDCLARVGLGEMPAGELSPDETATVAPTTDIGFTGNPITIGIVMRPIAGFASIGRLKSQCSRGAAIGEGQKVFDSRAKWPGRIDEIAIGEGQNAQKNQQAHRAEEGSREPAEWRGAQVKERRKTEKPANPAQGIEQPGGKLPAAFQENSHIAPSAPEHPPKRN